MPSKTKRPTSGLAGFLVVMLAGALFPSALAAQQTPVVPVPADEIVVTGLRDQLEAIKGYVNRLTVLNGNDPLARYQPGAYCPVALGLSPSRNAQIASRMVTVAAAAGVRPAKPGCRASALVIFVDNKQSFLESFRKQHPIYFSDLKDDDWSPPIEKGPASAWSLVQNLDPQGNPVRKDPETGIAIVESTTRGSAVLSMVTPVVAMSVVVIERAALRGLTVHQIGDYALMRTLTDRKAEDHRLRDLTILSALEAPMGSALPSSLTKYDLAYLKGRYQGDPALFGRSQRAAISRTMKRLVKTESE